MPARAASRLARDTLLSMCGRFFRHRPRDELAAAFHAMTVDDRDAPPGYNIAPSMPILAIRFNAKTAQRTIEPLAWGLVPHFAKDTKVAYKLTNARADSVDRLPSYRDAFARRRCLIPLDGFFEWAAIGKVKQPYAFALATHRPFAVAGLWENWKDPKTGQWLRTCTMITTDANDLVGAVHDRMPAILDARDHARWLGEEPEHLNTLKTLLQPFAAEPMVSWPVSRALNKPNGVDDPSLLDPVDVSELNAPT